MPRRGWRRSLVHHVSIRARHCWRAMRFTFNALSAFNFFGHFREHGDNGLCLQKIKPRKNQIAFQNLGLQCARTSE